jgi:hypothetical protein
MTDALDNEAAMLRATSDGLMLAIKEVTAREAQKRGVPPAAPGFVELAREVRIAAEVVLELARKEEATALTTVREPNAAELPPIESVVPGRELAAILEQWRAVEQRLEVAPPGSVQAMELTKEFLRLRDAYAAAIEARRTKR